MNTFGFIARFITIITVSVYSGAYAQIIDPYWGDLKSNCKDCDTTYLYTTTLDDSVFVAKKGGKYGIIDFNNRVIRPFEYDYISPELFDRSSQSLNIPPRKDTVHAHLVIRNEKYALWDKNLKMILISEYDGIGGVAKDNYYIENKLVLKNNNKVFLYDYINNYTSTFAYDSIRFYTDRSVHWSRQKEVNIASLNGKEYLIDSTGKVYYDFNNLRVRKSGNYEVLEDTVLNKVPLNICPMASLDAVNEVNTEYHYAIVTCLKKTFIVNKYGEMSCPFQGYPEIYHAKEQLFFGRKQGKLVGLFDMKGNEIGKLSKYKIAYPEYDMKTNECYYRFQDSKKRVGLMNMKGELLLECKYADLGTISDGKCMLYTTSKDQEEVELKTLKPKAW